jgi:chromosome segregation ATPase
MKTQIKKFLWFDITPRKELYKEIDDCEKSIKTLSDTVALLKKQMNEKNIKINTLTAGLKNSEDKRIDLQSEIHEMREIIENNKTRIISLERTIWDLEDEIRMLQGCCEDDDMYESY